MPCLDILLIGVQPLTLGPTSALIFPSGLTQRVTVTDCHFSAGTYGINQKIKSMWKDLNNANLQIIYHDVVIDEKKKV